MKKTKWTFNKNTNFNRDFLNIDEDVEKILKNRNISLDSQLDLKPFDFADMDKAVERILKAIENEETIYIYGDYDVDGITSVSLLYLAFTELGAKVSYYIPLRDEGYGLNNDAIKQLAEEGAKLIISVDCGINSIAEVELANSLGIDFIVTDHHEILGTLPNALAVINPKREENIYKFKYLAGVGTAYMLACAVFLKKDRLQDIYKYLDIVAIGTVADIVPLVDDNRKFVAKGLKLFNDTKCTGLKRLLFKIYKDEMYSKKFVAYDVGYVIAPIFNAAGRLEDAKNAVELFIEEDAVLCNTMIDSLIKNNDERKKIQKKIFEKSLKQIEERKLNEKNVLIVYDKSFHHGVIGIVASKLLDKFYKPTIVMEVKEAEGVATASCRSVAEINIAQILSQCSDLLVKYGGHSGAAGFTIEIDKIPVFEKRLEYLIGSQEFTKQLAIDGVLAPYKISYSFLKDLELLEPFGASNQSPIFAMKNCTVSKLRFTKNSSEHLMMDIEKDGYTFKNSIFFGGGEYYDLLSKNSLYDFAFKLNLETFMDRFYYKIQIQDVKMSRENQDSCDGMEKNGKDYKLPFETVCYTRKNDVTDPLRLDFSRRELALIKDRMVVANLDEATSNLLRKLKEEFNYNFKVKLKDKIFKMENCNLVIEISKDETFQSTALKLGNILTDIKKFLIGDFKYNSIESKVLASVFKNKKKTLAIMNYGRGINTIVKNIELYCKHTNKKMYYSESDICKEKYDFYVFVNPQAELFPQIEQIESDNILVISETNILLANFEKIVDNYITSSNIEIVSLDEVEEKFREGETVYHRYLVDSNKLELINNLAKYDKVYATMDICIHF